MKLLAFTLNLLFLFIFGAGQICFCTESDDCQGAANFFVSIEPVTAGPKELKTDQTSATSQDCCVDCLNSIDVAMWTGNLFDGTNFEASAPIPSWTAFAIIKNACLERPSVRAPPNGFGSPGTKTYLTLQSLLI